MTADREILDAFEQVFGTPAFRLPPDPSTHEDEDTLRRSFGGLSRRARHQQRTGRYFPAVNDEGLDRDGWAVGAEYPRRAS